MSCSVTFLAPQKLGIDNINLVNVLLNISDIVGYIFVLPMSHTVKRKSLNFYTQSTIIIIGFFLLMNDETRGSKYYPIRAVFLSCI